MISISSIIEQKIKGSPFIADALSKDLINISQLARLWHTEVEEKTKKQITIEALSMAIRRAQPPLASLSETKPTISPSLIKPRQITVKDSLCERTYANSDTLMRNYKASVDMIESHKQGFITHTTGVFETTIIVDAQHVSTVEFSCRTESLKAKIDNLAAVTLGLSEEVIKTPGSYYQILGKLAWNGINLIEVVSTAHELTLIVEESDTEPTLRAIKG